MMRSEWPVGNASSLEAMAFFTMNATPEWRQSFGRFPVMKMVSSAPCSWGMLSLVHPLEKFCRCLAYVITVVALVAH